MTVANYLEDKAPAATTKQCADCREWLDRSAFGIRRASRDGLNYYCKPCVRIRGRVTVNTWRHRHPELAREYQRGWYRRRGFKNGARKRYGITPDEYDRLLAEQSGVCRICRRPERRLRADGTPTHLAVDHDNATGRVRGLLCSNCNVAIGMLDHDTGLLAAALRYLEGQQ